MILRRLAFGLVLCSPIFTVHAAEITVTGLTVPESDAAGHLLRRLTAESGTGWPNEKSKLKNGRVEFFAAAILPPERLATLDFSDATYDPERRMVAGDGHVVFHSPRGDLAGDGFRYDLTNNRLWLKSAVTFDRDRLHLVGGEGEALLAQAPTGQGALIEHATVKGGVVATGIADPKFDFDEARTEAAVYAANDETVVLASPVDVWKKGKKISTTANEITIHLDPRRKSAAHGASPEVPAPTSPAKSR